MKIRSQCHSLLPLLLFFTLISLTALGQNNERRERNIDEIRVEAIRRAEVGQYPLIGLDPADVKEAFESIHTSDKDEWAAAFMHVADRYFNEAKSLEKSDPTKANADYIRAWRLYSFGRWPIPASPGKQRSYEKAIEAFLAHARFMDPPLEVVHIPFEGKEVTAYLRLPKDTKGPAPLVIAVNGLDSRKEDLAESFGAILPFGVGYLAVDGPGTGQNPVQVSETADRVLSKVIDYAQSRPEIDKNRIAMHGVSWGAYWATKMSILERTRLRGCSAQSPPVDKFFQKDFIVNSLLGNREYLFDQIPALMSIMEGVHSLDEMEEFMPKLSLVREGLLGKPMAPMLVIAGVLDTQVPIDDEYLLLSKGDVPKDAWINPRGGHLGRQVGVWPDPLIFKQVIIPWLVKTLEAPACSGRSAVAASTSLRAGSRGGRFRKGWLEIPSRASDGPDIYHVA
ncbi:MAG TPA: alpha/beta hydrolase [Candidatus Acidoferrales bacterium]|nr:alpha/beta hydrolase [Candidatus Acidoferrales bacterium]